MDANPWTYAIASVEMRREGKIEDDPAPGHNAIADPRRFVYVEACGASRQRRARSLHRQRSVDSAGHGQSSGFIRT